MRNPFWIALLALGFGAVAPAQAVHFPFFIFENDDQVDLSGCDLWVDVLDAGNGSIDFVFGNSSSADFGGVITNIYFEQTDLLALSPALKGNGASVRFHPGARPNTPPGSTGAAGGAWLGTLYSASAIAPSPSHGIHPGEFLTVRFDLASRGTFGDVLTELTKPGGFRLAEHIQSVGAEDTSSLWGRNSQTPVPEPATALLLVAGLALGAGYRRLRRRHSSP